MELSGFILLFFWLYTNHYSYSVLFLLARTCSKPFWALTERTQCGGTSKPVLDIHIHSSFLSHSRHCTVPSRVGKQGLFGDIPKTYIPPVTSDLNLVQIRLAINI